MPSRADLARIASRYDTAMSRAMLRALGCVSRAGVGRRAARGKRGNDSGKYRGMRWCFRNFGSPMR